ncbi:MAG: MBL fold metallo-hydrolase [Pseudomonadota bacterium]|nr:MAG: MBL fold metallo-hydrolase [Pseudomonadota bacterium]
MKNRGLLPVMFAVLIVAACDAARQNEQVPPSPMRDPALQEAMSNFAPATVEVELKKVSDHVYFVEGVPGIATDNQGFISNAGAVVTDAGVVVFDALGTPSLAHLMLEKLRAVTDQPIVKVIVSHYHADHIYGLQVFKEQGAEIIAPAGALDYLNSEQAESRLEERRFSLDPWVNETTHLVAPDRLLQKSERFSVGGVDFTVSVLGSAHSDGDLTLYVEPDRVLFSGDIIFEGRVPFLGDANTRTWLDVLERMEALKLVALIPGHGPLAADPNQAIALTRRYLARVREVMGTAADDMTAFAEAYERADWSEFENLPAFEEAHRRNAYQVYLSMEEELAEN